MRSLARLGKVHPGLPAVAVRRACGPKTHAWDAAVTWDDVISDSIAVVIGRYDQDADDLPADVYVAGNSYPIARFTLDDAGARKLGQLCELLPGVEPSDFSVWLGREAVEQALALKSAHASANGYAHVIVGQDVADQLATDYIGGCLLDTTVVALNPSPNPQRPLHHFYRHDPSTRSVQRSSRQRSATVGNHQARRQTEPRRGPARAPQKTRR